MSSTYWQEISFYIREIDREKLTFEKSSPTVESIDSLRKTLLHQLNQLKYNLLASLDEHLVSIMLFALAATFDEEVQRTASENALHWSPISKEFYGDFTAGELFYKCIDEVLDSPKAPPIVFEVFYFALKRGFRGQHRGSKVQVSKYLDLLLEKIPTSENIHTQHIETLRKPLNRLKLTKKQYYGLALGCVFCAFCGLYILSSIG